MAATGEHAPDQEAARGLGLARAFRDIPEQGLSVLRAAWWPASTQ